MIFMQKSAYNQTKTGFPIIFLALSITRDHSADKTLTFGATYRPKNEIKINNLFLEPMFQHCHP